MDNTFNKKYMHPTRRKLADMVVTGKYETNTTIAGFDKTIDRKVGDIWEDEHNTYEKKEGYTMINGKNSKQYEDIRKYLEKAKQCKHPECKTIRKSPTDLKLIAKIGYCVGCNAEIETDLRFVGIFQEYKNYRIWTRMIIYGKTKIDELKHTLNEVKQEYEYIHEDGTSEKWKLPRPVDEVKIELQEIIDNSELELIEIEKLRNEALEVIRSKNYEHVL